MTNPVSEANRAGYDRWAGLYDGYVNSTVAVDDLYFPALWADVRGQDVLEIGCGTGRHTLRLATQGNRVTGIDLSPGMLAQAREKLKGYDVRLVEADIMAGDLPLGLFDAAMTALVLEHIDDPGRFFARVAAHLKPGGRFHVSEIHPERIAAGTQANFVAEDGTHVRLTSFAHTAGDIETAAAGAGFHIVHQQDIIGGDDLARINPDWERHRGRKMIRIWVLQKV